MESLSSKPLRLVPSGLSDGAPRTRIAPPRHAWELVAAEMAGSELALRQLLGGHAEGLTGAGRYLADSGGKRIRPLLTALGARAAGVGGDLCRLMCVGELIHLGSLLHDDVVDDARKRRGRPAAQEIYGNAVVILSGDYCLARGVLVASEEGGHACVSGLAQAVLAMSEGELLQLQRAGVLDTTREDYLGVVERKSAALIAWCAAVGAHILDDAALAAEMEAFGRSIGVAFQITDDVLDYRGGQTGKLPGADLRERKLTLPLLHAMERMPELRERLAEPPTPEQLPGLIAEITATGALEQASEDAEALIAEGMRHLRALPPSPYRSALEDLAHYLVERVA